MTSKFVDKIDPYHKAVRRHRKSEGSSRYHNKDATELEPLALLKGKIKKICQVFYDYLL